MDQCLLTVRGLLWLGSLGFLAGLGLFAAAALINRWIREQETAHD